MPFYRFEGLVPVVDPSAYVHPTAVVIGDVIIGAKVYIGPNAVLRGDYGRLIVEQGANIQDGCMMHGYCDYDTVVERDGHIGHGAILHGCVIGADSLVGMNSVIMDGAKIGPQSIVAAMSFVKVGFSGEPRQLIAGSPATVKRQVNDDDIRWKQMNTKEYQLLAARSQRAMVETTPLTAVEPNRPRLQGSTAVQVSAAATKAKQS